MHPLISFYEFFEWIHTDSHQQVGALSKMEKYRKTNRYRDIWKYRYRTPKRLQKIRTIFTIIPRIRHRPMT